MIKTIFISGNELVEIDSMQLKLIPELRKKLPKVEFIEYDPNDNLDKLGRNPIILDSAKGIKKITILKDLKKIESQKIYSMHDFDLGLNLLLMKKMNMLDKPILILLPMPIKKEKALKELIAIIKNLKCN